MTIRELVISFGYEVNAQAEKKVNASIESLKATAAKALGATDVSYKVDKNAEKKAIESIEAIGEAADGLESNAVGFDVNNEALHIAFNSIDELQEAAWILQDNDVGFDVNEAKKAIVFNSIDELQEAAATLERNTVGYEVDRLSEQQAKNSIRSIHALATRLLGAIGIGLSFVALGRLSEEFGGINDQIRNATRHMGDQAEIQQRIKRAANDARQSYQAMGDTISRLVETQAFDNVEDAAQFATLMAQDLAAAGHSQQHSAALMRQISTSLQQGRVDARAMMIMFRESPQTVNMLANSLGVTAEALNDMAKRGEISSEVLKNAFIDNADDIAARFGELDLTISDALRNVRNGWGLFVAEMDSTLGISRAIARLIVNGFNQVLFILRRAQDAFSRLANRVGGVNNLMRLLLISSGAVFATLNAGRILSFLRSVSLGLLKIKAKVLALAAVIIILALLIDDFLAFMRGDDSLLGEMLEKFGIDADEVRGIITDLWDVIRGILPFVKELSMEFLRRLIPMVADFARQLIPLIVDALQMLIPILFRIIEAVLPVLISLIESLLPAILTIIETVLPIVISLLESLLPIALQIIEMILPILLNLLDALIPVIAFVAQLLGNVLGAAFEGLIPIINAFMQILGGVIDFIAGVFTGDWERAWEGIRNIFSGIISGLAAIFKLPINLIITGINTFIRGLNHIRIPDWVPGIGGMGINIPEIPMLAKGSNSSPDTFIAGEEGPELITNAKGSKVFTATETTDIFKKLNALSRWSPKPPADTAEPKISCGFKHLGDFFKKCMATIQKALPMGKAKAEKPANLVRPPAYIAPPPADTAARYNEDVAQALKSINELSFSFVEAPNKPPAKAREARVGVYEAIKGIAKLISASDDAAVEAYYSSDSSIEELSRALAYMR